MSTISERATEKPAPRYRSRIVEDDDFARALDYLRDSAPEVGKAREAMIKAEKYLKHVEALLIKGSTASSSEKRIAEARCDDKWLKAAYEEAEAAGRFETWKSMREAAAAKIEAWRSEQANFRGMKT